MKKSQNKRRVTLAWTSLLLTLGCGDLLAQHAHLNAGALQPTQNSQLYFPNGANFVTNSGFVVPLTATNSGQYAGYFNGALTVTALPATLYTGGPAFGHAALGSDLQLRIETVAGPVGGEFGFWEPTDRAPRFSLASGLTNGTNRIPLSERGGVTGGDPYGHIHGRRFTATRPGLYTVGMRILDLSANGSGGGPIHTPSDRAHIHFQAGITINSLRRVNGTVTVGFATLASGTYFLESRPSLGSDSEWTTVAGPLTADSRLRVLLHSNSPSGDNFYRLRVTHP